MFEALKNIFKKSKIKELANSKDAAKERLHLVLMQDRANVSADFLDLMRAEIVEVIKKYIDIDEKAMDVRLTTETNEDGTQGGPALYANIPIINIKEETRKLSKVNQDEKIISQPPKNVNNDKNEDDSKLVEKENEKETDNNKNNIDDSKSLENKVESIENQETENKTVDIVVSNSDENIDKNNVHKDKSKETNNEVKDDDKENEESKENINKTEKIEKDETKNENQINNSNENKEDIKEKKNEEENV